MPVAVFFCRLTLLARAVARVAERIGSLSAVDFAGEARAIRHVEGICLCAAGEVFKTGERYSIDSAGIAAGDVPLIRLIGADQRIGFRPCRRRIGCSRSRPCRWRPGFAD